MPVALALSRQRSRVRHRSRHFGWPAEREVAGRPRADRRAEEAIPVAAGGAGCNCPTPVKPSSTPSAASVGAVPGARHRRYSGADRSAAVVPVRDGVGLIGDRAPAERDRSDSGGLALGRTGRLGTPLATVRRRTPVRICRRSPSRRRRARCRSRRPPKTQTRSRSSLTPFAVLDSAKGTGAVARVRASDRPRRTTRAPLTSAPRVASRAPRHRSPFPGARLSIRGRARLANSSRNVLRVG